MRNSRGRATSTARAVEYALDYANGEAVFVRDHSLHGTRSTVGFASGYVEPLDNGDWLISWGRSIENLPAIDQMFTQVDPQTGMEKLWVANSTPFDRESSIRVLPLPPEGAGGAAGCAGGNGSSRAAHCRDARRPCGPAAGCRGFQRAGGGSRGQRHILAVVHRPGGDRRERWLRTKRRERRRTPLQSRRRECRRTPL